MWFCIWDFFFTSHRWLSFSQRTWIRGSLKIMKWSSFSLIVEQLLKLIYTIYSWFSIDAVIKSLQFFTFEETDLLFLEKNKCEEFLGIVSHLHSYTCRDFELLIALESFNSDFTWATTVKIIFKVCKFCIRYGPKFISIMQIWSADQVAGISIHQGNIFGILYLVVGSLCFHMHSFYCISVLRKHQLM